MDHSWSSWTAPSGIWAELVSKNYYIKANNNPMPRPTTISQTEIFGDQIFFLKVCFLKGWLFQKDLGAKYVIFVIHKTSTKINKCIFGNENVFFLWKDCNFFMISIFIFKSDNKSCISHNNAWSKVDKATKKAKLQFYVKAIYPLLIYFLPILKKNFLKYDAKTNWWGLKIKSYFNN